MYDISALNFIGGKVKDFLKNNIYFYVLGIVVILGILLRLKGFIINPSFWHDECALGWNILHKSYLELFDKLRFLQVAPPLFLVCSKFLVWALPVKTNASACDFVLRMLPLIIGSLSIGAFYYVCKSVVLSKWTTLIAVLLFSLNPVLISYSFEFKPYIFDVFSTLIVLFIFLNIDFLKISNKKLWLYGGILAILPWFSFMSAIVEFAGFLTLSYKKEAPKKFFLMALPVILSIFIYLKSFILKVYEQNSKGMLNYWQNEFVNKDFSNITQLNLENMNYFFSNLPFFSCTFFVILMFIGAILFFKSGRLRFLFMSVLIESTLILASIMHVYPYSTRLIIFLIPILIIFGVKIFDIENKILAGILLTFVIIPHLIFGFNFLKLQNLHKGEFARGLITQIANNIENQDTVVVNKASNVEFLYYNSFVKLPNKTIFLKSNPIEELNAFSKGKYWFYMPYFDKNPKEVNEITKWLEKNSKIIFKAQSVQSTLIHTILD